MSSTEDSDSWEGQVLASQFKIEKQLGEGGMGVVFLAEQLGMDRKVVIKVMHAHMTANEQAVERFKREAKSVGKLNHPNIVQIFMFGETDDGSLYIAMEFVEGRSLTDEMKKTGRFAEPRALRIVDQVLSALLEAHAAGIVHRDLKPDNIMLSDRLGNPDFVKVLDFGLVKLLGDAAPEVTLTQVGTVAGTPRYMSPEQARGGHIDGRTDIYALGLILFEMLTGRHPFKAESALEFLHLQITAVVPSPREVVEDLNVSPRVESTLGKALTKKAVERYQSAREFQRDVRAGLRDLPDAQREYPTPPDTSARAETEVYTPKAPPEAPSPPVPAGPAAPVSPPPTAPESSEADKQGSPSPKRSKAGLLAVAGGLAVVIAIVLAVALSGTGPEKEEPEAVKAASGEQKAAVKAAMPVAGEKEAKTPPAEPPGKGETEGMTRRPIALRSPVEPILPGLPGGGTRAAATESAGAAKAEPVRPAAVEPARAIATKPAQPGTAGAAGAAAARPAEAGAGASKPAGKVGFRGLPGPEQYEMISSSPEAVQYRARATGKELAGLYRGWFEQKGIEFVEYEGYVGTKDPKSYVSVVSISPLGDGWCFVNVVLNEGIAPPETHSGGYFGEEVYPGSRVYNLSDEMVTYSVEAPLDDVINWYDDRYRKVPGASVMRSAAARTWSLTLGMERPGMDFYAIVVSRNTTSPGGRTVNIVVSKRPR